MYKEEELKESYVYLAYYKDKSLFGWNIAKLLEQNAVGGNFQIKSGLYKVNMIDPPGQGLPFDENKMIKNNVMAEFTIMKSSDKQISLADYNTYIPIEGLKERPKKSIKPQEKKIVKNQRWNTQIIL